MCENGPVLRVVCLDFLFLEESAKILHRTYLKMSATKITYFEQELTTCVILSIFQSKDETEGVVKVRRRVWPIC
jgi:hypothetical protein